MTRYLTDYRQIPHPDAVERWAKGKLFEWVVCSKCGKQYQREVMIDEEPRLRDAFVKWCSICEMEVHRERDECPESIIGPGFGAACRLPFQHEGHCEPYEIPQEAIDAIRAEKEAQEATEKPPTAS